MSNLSKINYCAASKHQFVVAAWKISPNKHAAVEFVCQNCLMTATKQEVELLAQERAKSSKGS